MLDLNHCCKGLKVCINGRVFSCRRGNEMPTAYYMTGVNGAKKIEQVPEERDLGILITDEMKWSKQCNSAAAKAMSVLGMINRTFNTLNKEMFLTLYSTYIRPHLEYCIQVWARYFKKDIDIPEKVQRLRTKLRTKT